jgi:glucan biosynthesis protein C
MTMTRVVEDARPVLESGMPPAHPPHERRPELDLMRAFVVVGLIVEHAAVVFVSTEGWFVNDPHPNVGFGIFVTWASTWGMPLLMLVSGMGVCYALRHRSAGAFVRERLGRLGVPFVVGMVALVPPMWYLRLMREPDFHMSYGRFWLRFFDLPAMAKGLPLRAEWSAGGMVFDPAHTWFLYVLLVWSMVLLPVFLYLRSHRGAGLVDRVAGFVERHGLVTLVAFAAPVMLAEAAFGANDNTGAWDRVPFLFFLLYGFLIALDGRFEAALRRGRRVALVAALPASVALMFWAGEIDKSGGELMNGSQTGWSGLQALTGWLWVVAILGYASAIVNGRSRRSSKATPSRSRWARVERYANEAVLPFYVLHLPVIVGAAWVIVRWHAPILAKYFALVIASFAGTLALYELLVRRYRVTRLLFGMKAVAPARDPRRTAAPREDGPQAWGSLGPAVRPPEERGLT